MKALATPIHPGETPTARSFHVRRGSRSVRRRSDRSIQFQVESLEQRLLLADWSGDIPDGTVWDNSEVQRIIGDATIPDGSTLSVLPGTIVKFEPGTSLIVDGTLLADGTAGQSIVFTSSQDDSVGGDTNGNGPSTGSGGDWGRITFGGTSVGSVMDHVDVRFGGQFIDEIAALVFVNGGSLTLSNSVVRDSRSEGLRLVNASATVTNTTFRNNFDAVRIEGSDPAITGCTFLDNGAALSMDLASDPVVVNPTFENNGINGLRLDAGTLPGSASWDDPDVVYYFDGDITVPQGATLTVAAGQVIKAPSGNLMVEGRLLANGSTDRPVIFTSRSDDSAGGDTDNGGPSLGQGDWQGGLVFTALSAGSVLDHTEVRFGGSGFGNEGLVQVLGGELTLRDSVVRNTALVGVRVVGGDVVVTRTAFLESFLSGLVLVNATAVVTDSVFRDNVAGYGIRIEASSPTITGCTFLGNGAGALSMDLASDPAIVGATIADNGINGLRLDAGTLAGSASWDDPDVVYYFDGDITVPQDATLTVAAGQVIKSPLGNLMVEGRLLANGTAARPVIFTSRSDDSVGGDTGNNGPSTGGGDWAGGLVFTATSAGSVLDHTEVRYGGPPISAMVLVSGSDLTLRDSVVSNSSWEGLRVEDGDVVVTRTVFLENFVNGLVLVNATAAVTDSVFRDSGRYGIRIEGSSPTITGCTFLSNGEFDLSDAAGALSMDLASDPAIVGATIAGNLINGLRLDAGTLPGSATWGDTEVVYYLAGDITVPPAATLTVAAGQVVKSAQGVLRVEGRLLANGSAARPVVFTSRSDDTVGGDTGNNGPSSGRGDWQGGLVFAAPSAGSVLDHTEVRFGSGFEIDGLVRVLNSELTVRNSVVRDANCHGLDLVGGTLLIENSLIFGNIRNGDGVGLRVLGGHLTAINNTIADNEYAGVFASGIDSHVTLVNNLITHNPGVGVFLEEGATLDASFNDVFNPGAFPRNYVGIADQTGSNGNISADPKYFNRANGQYHLRAGSSAVDAGTSDGARATDFLGNPRFDDPNVINRGGGASPFVDLGAIERQQTSTPSGIDLTTTQVSGPPTGLQDDTVTVAWTIQNAGTVTAVGAWSDAVYLSADRVWTPDDVLLKQVVHEGGLGAGQTYSASASVTLPGALPGDYYFLVRANGSFEVFEGSALANNVGAAANPIALDLPELTLGTPLNGPLPAAGAARFYKVIAPAGADLGVGLTGQAGAVNELYLKFGDVPSRQSFDTRGAVAGSADQAVAVGSARAGNYYVMVRSASQAPNQTFTLTASLREFSITGVGPAQGSNTGQVTLAIEGARFGAGSRPRLIDSAGGTIEPVRVYLDNSRRLHATFDLTGRSLGRADVQVVNPSGATARLPGGFDIVTGQAGRLVTNLVAPSEVRLLRLFPIVIEYANEGDADLLAPVMQLRATAGVELSLRREGSGGADHLDLIGVNPAGPAGVLPPGARGRITVYAIARDADSVTFDLIIAEYPELPMDWSAIGEQIRPDGISDVEWNALRAALEANIGDTWDDFHRAISLDASLLPAALGLNYSLRDALQLELEKARARFNISVSGRLLLRGTDQPLGNVPIQLVDAAEAEFRATVSLTDGSFVIPAIPPGTYNVRLEGYVVQTPTELVVTASELSDVNLAVDFGGTLAGSVVSSPTGVPLRNLNVSASSDQGDVFVTTTDSEGRFAIDSLPVGVYEISAADARFVPMSVSGIELAAGEIRQGVHFALREGGTIRGRVTGPTGTVLGALVSALDANGEGQTAITDDFGAYDIPALAAGTYTVRAGATGLVTAQTTGIQVITAETTSDVDLVLSSGGSVDGTLTQVGTGLAAPFAFVGLQGPAGTFTVQTGSDGSFEFTEIPPGSYSLETTSLTFMTTTASAEVTANTTRTVDLVTARRGAVSGVVTNAATGLPLQKVVVYVADAIGIQASALTDTAGGYAFEGLDAGSYRVVVGDEITPGVAQTNVTLSASANVAVADFQISIAGILNGAVFAPDGQTPVLGSVVLLRREGEAILSMRTDAEGRFAFVVVASGAYELDATARNLAFPTITNIVVDAGVTLAGLNFTAGAEQLGGVVRDATTLAGLQHAVIQVRSVGQDGRSTFVASVTTDQDGRFTHTAFIPGSFVVDVLAEGHAFVSQMVQVTPGQPAQVTFNLVAETTLFGVLRDPAGQPIAGAILELVDRADRSSQVSATTDLTGAYRIDGLGAGTYDLAVRAAGFESLVIPAVVVPQNGALLNIALELPNTTVSGRVTAPIGAIAQATVTAFDSDGRVIGETQSNGAGEYVLNVLPPGSYSLVASAAGYRSTTLGPVAVADGSSVLNVGFELLAVAIRDAETPTNAQAAVDLDWLSSLKDPTSTGYDPDHPSASRIPTTCPKLSPAKFKEKSDEARSGVEAANDRLSILGRLFEALRLDLEIFQPFYKELLTLVSRLDSAFRPVFELEQGQDVTIDASGTNNSLDFMTLHEFVRGLRTRFDQIGFRNVPMLLREGDFASAAASIATETPFSDLKSLASELQELIERRGGVRVYFEELFRLVKDLGVVKDAIKELDSIEEFLLPTVQDDAARINFPEFLRLVQEYRVAEKAYADAVLEANGRIRALRTLCNSEPDPVLKCKKAAGGGTVMSVLENRDEDDKIVIAGATPRVLGVVRTFSGRFKRDSSPSQPDAGGLFGGVGLFRPFTSCSAPDADSGGSTTTSVDAAIDPNDKIGPAGFGQQGFIQSGVMPYEVLFENDPNLGATAAAQIVVVTDTLDADLDLSTFEFTEFGFGAFRFDVPAGLSHYETMLDLRPDGINLIVPAVLDVDFTTRVLIARFESLDPLTLMAPDGVDDGFLPVNDKNLHNGEGYFAYRVSPRVGLPSGTEITNQASIVFDTNAPILTPTTRHTLDIGGPISNVSPLAAQQSSTSFPVNWSGSDDAGGSGIATFDIFVSDNRGPFQLWLDDTTATSASFAGQELHTYAFFSVATDNVGHVQVSPRTAGADATTQVADLTGPTIETMELIRDAKGKKVLRIVLKFGETLNESGAETLANYSLVTRKGTKVKPAPLASATYDAAAQSVTLVPVKTISVKKLGTFELTARGDGTLADASPSLNRLDGDSNGTSGGDFVRSLSQAAARASSRAGVLAVVDEVLSSGQFWREFKDRDEWFGESLEKMLWRHHVVPRATGHSV